MTALTLARSARNDRSNTGAFARQAARIGGAALGWLVILLGILIAPLPGPGGIPVITVGLILVLRSSYAAKRWFIRAQHRFPKALTPIRRLLRRNPPIAQMMWQQLLRVERLVAGKGHRFFARLRRSIKAGRRSWRAA